MRIFHACSGHLCTQSRFAGIPTPFFILNTITASIQQVIPRSNNESLVRIGSDQLNVVRYFDFVQFLVPELNRFWSFCVKLADYGVSHNFPH